MAGAILFSTPYGVARGRIIDALKGNEWLLPKDVAVRTRLTISNVRYRLYDLVDQGLVERRQLAGWRAYKYEYRLKQTGETT